MDWDEVCSRASAAAAVRGGEYVERLQTEVAEISKQGAETYWTECVSEGRRWEHNQNGLVIPFLLGMTPVDPVAEAVSHEWVRLTDFPDIDLDFLPHARETIKQYARERYVHVCSIGNWVTYKPRSALTDVARALGADWRAVSRMTKGLPDEFDDMSLGDIDGLVERAEDPDPEVRRQAHVDASRLEEFMRYRSEHPEIVDLAFRLVGKIRAQSTHAGGIVIADRDLRGVVPLSRMKGTWTSQWTEGRSMQLSKFGLIKFDVLGLKTMFYVWQAGNLVLRNRGVLVVWDGMDPRSDLPVAGYLERDGRREPISFNDVEALRMCNDLRTDSVFQIETDIQKGIISDGGVRDFWDLIVYNALGRPGPMDMIPEYIRRRDDHSGSWRKGMDPRIVRILEETHGIICFQEQLTAVWIQIGRFTVPEAEKARKIVSKKWLDKLPGVEERWMSGAGKELGEEEARKWWDQMVTFGRYAFNKSHAVAYSIMTYRCLYLKAHYPAEWWAAVLSACPAYKMSSYMGSARSDGVEFAPMDVNSLEKDFTVSGDQVLPGLASVKGIGDKAAEKLASVCGPFRDVDEMVERCGKDKRIFERLIKLGGFDSIHPNRKALWTWYLYKYCSGKEITALRREIEAKFEWPQEKVEKERARQASEYFKLYPRRKKLPSKIAKWRPKITVTRGQVMSTVGTDWSLAERLEMEKEFLGHYWSSPMEAFRSHGHTVERAKVGGTLEGVVEKIESRSSKAGNQFYVLHVNDGIRTARVFVWADAYGSSDKRALQEGAGIRMNVVYDRERDSFKIGPRSVIVPLSRRGEASSPEEELDVYSEGQVLW